MMLKGKTQASVDADARVAALKAEEMSLLAWIDSTDWMAARKTRTGKDIPQEVQDKYLEATARISEIRSLCKAAL
jgi:hypothetical protein